MPKFDANKKVGGSVANEHFPKEWCKNIFVARLKATEISPERAQAALLKVSSYLTADTHGGDWFSIQSSLKEKPWRTCFHDDDGTTIGISRNDKDRGGAEYYAVVMSGSDHVGQELQKLILQSPNMTASDLVSSDEYKRTANYARTNALRILAHIGTALDEQITPEEDQNGHWPSGNGVRAPPYLVIPDYETHFNVLTQDADESVFYHPHASPGKTITTVGKGNVIQPVDPLYGFLIRRMNSPQESEPIGVSARNKQSGDCKYYMDLKNVGQLRKNIVSTFTRPDGESPTSQAEMFWKYNTQADPIAYHLPDDIRLKPLHFLVNAPASKKP